MQMCGQQSKAAEDDVEATTEAANEAVAEDATEGGAEAPSSTCGPLLAVVVRNACTI